jgi:hypothetical protein
VSFQPGKITGELPDSTGRDSVVAGSQYDTEAEGDGLPLIQLKVERFAALAEDLLAQGLAANSP